MIMLLIFLGMCYWGSKSEWNEGARPLMRMYIGRNAG